MPTIHLLALRIGAGLVGSLGWYWSLPRRERQAADARTRERIERTCGTSARSLSAERARAVYGWARARHA